MFNRRFSGDPQGYLVQNYPEAPDLVQMQLIHEPPHKKQPTSYTFINQPQTYYVVQANKNMYNKTCAKTYTTNKIIITM